MHRAISTSPAAAVADVLVLRACRGSSDHEAVDLTGSFVDGVRSDGPQSLLASYGSDPT